MSEYIEKGRALVANAKDAKGFLAELFMGKDDVLRAGGLVTMSDDKESGTVAIAGFELKFQFRMANNNGDLKPHILVFAADTDGCRVTPEPVVIVTLDYSGNMKVDGNSIPDCETVKEDATFIKFVHYCLGAVVKLPELETGDSALVKHPEPEAGDKGKSTGSVNYG